MKWTKKSEENAQHFLKGWFLTSVFSTNFYDNIFLRCRANHKACSHSLSAPVTESMMKPRTTTSAGTSG